ncbi:MAG: TIGR03617 family F420-dependent LLM class oxidoreductase [Candidatus Binatia bacterium]
MARPLVIETGFPFDDLARIPEAVRHLEALGFDAIAAPEINRDPFFPLLVAAQHTTRLQLGTAVAIAFPRAPMVTAQIAWDLQRFSRGRFVLGLGSQVRKHNEERFSVPWSAPIPRMREYVQTLRAIWDSWQHGTRATFVGKHYRYTYMTPFFNPGPIEHPRIPVHVSAVNPAMCRLVGELCDGARLHGFCTRRYLDEVILPNIAAGAQKAGRTLDDVELSGGGFLATGTDDAAVREQFEIVRMQVSFYGSTPAYQGVFALHGWQDLGEKLNRLSREGRWGEMVQAVPDDVVHAIAAVGRWDEIVPRIRERFRGVTRLMLPPPGASARDEAAVREVLADLRNTVDNAA